MSSQVAGESPLFPPDYESATAAQDAIEHVVHQTPRNFNLERTRWTLKLLRNTLPGLNLASDSALHHLLKRLNIRDKRGRDYTHSPDVDYVAKCDQIASYQARARRNPVAFPLYFLDELPTIDSRLWPMRTKLSAMNSRLRYAVIAVIPKHASWGLSIMWMAV